MMQADDPAYLAWRDVVERAYLAGGPQAALQQIAARSPAPSSPFVALRRGLMYLQLERWEDALATLSPLRDEPSFVGHPERGETLRALIHAHSAVGDNVRANALLVAHRELADDPTPYFDLARHFLFEEDAAQAEGALVEVATKLPASQEQPRFWLALARLRLLQGSLLDAIDAAGRALALKDSAMGHELQGLAYYQLNHLPQAEAAARRAHEIWPYCGYRLKLLIDVLVAQALVEEAKRLTSFGQAEHTNVGYFPYRMATLLEREGRLGEALGFAYKSVELEPNNSLYWAGVANFLLRMRDGQAQGEDALRRALSLTPVSGVAQHLARMLGWPAEPPRTFAS